jgi:hypothetical protein
MFLSLQYIACPTTSVSHVLMCTVDSPLKEISALIWPCNKAKTAVYLQRRDGMRGMIYLHLPVNTSRHLWQHFQTSHFKHALSDTEKLHNIAAYIWAASQFLILFIHTINFLSAWKTVFSIQYNAPSWSDGKQTDWCCAKFYNKNNNYHTLLYRAA